MQNVREPIGNLNFSDEMLQIWILQRYKYVLLTTPKAGWGKVDAITAPTNPSNYEAI
jgi:hypothetical protein